MILCGLLFDLTAREMSNPYKAAFVVGASQIVLNVDLVLQGDRGVHTGAAGTVLLVVTWLCIAFVYSRLGGNSRKSGPDSD